MADEGTIRSDGTIEWRDAKGRLDREDGPAVVHANGSVKHYLDGVRHREGGPACVYVTGTEKWYRRGLRHRDDGPAAIYPDGRRIWFIEGQKVHEERSARQSSLSRPSRPARESAALEDQATSSCFVTTHSGVTPSHAQRSKI